VYQSSKIVAGIAKYMAYLVGEIHAVTLRQQSRIGGSEFLYCGQSPLGYGQIIG
jgi:hypothetical protein